MIKQKKWGLKGVQKGIGPDVLFLLGEKEKQTREVKSSIREEPESEK